MGYISISDLDKKSEEKLINDSEDKHNIGAILSSVLKREVEVLNSDLKVKKRGNQIVGFYSDID